MVYGMVYKMHGIDIRFNSEHVAHVWMKVGLSWKIASLHKCTPVSELPMINISTKISTKIKMDINSWS